MVVGSTALQYHNCARRPPLDVDIWTDDPSEILPNADSHLVSTEILQKVYHPSGYATPDVIYTIKCSHAVYDIKWEKTKTDILWLKHKDCKILPDLYTLLIAHWKEVHGNKEFLSLNKSKDNFFTDFVEYTHDHDYLHELVAYPKSPVYKACLKEGEEVQIDKDKFFSLDLARQIRMFREEITVIALERWMLNPKIKVDIPFTKVYSYALRKTVTSLTKGWASRFLVENMRYFVKPNFTYFKHALLTLKEEVIMLNELAVESLINDLKTTESGFSESDMENVSSDHCELYSENLSRFISDLVEEDYYDCYNIEILHQEGGGEGGAENCELVFRFDPYVSSNIYKFAYRYSSFFGYDTSLAKDTLRIVTSKEKTITVYE